MSVDGKGVSLVQQSKKALKRVLSKSRSGLHVDYPAAPVDDEGKPRPFTIQEVQSGQVKPIIRNYDAIDIINWRVADYGSEVKLSLVVLAETYDNEDDESFGSETYRQFRVLRLIDGFYVQQIWRETSPTKISQTLKANLTGNSKRFISSGNFEIYKTYNPKNSKGQMFDYIPFTFIGSENNDPDPDEAAFYDLASLNMAHYRNSADAEESAFVVGQPTPVLSGLTEKWYEDVLKGTVNFGSRGGIPLPKDGRAELLQAESNNLATELMERKERQMVALGAKLVEQKQVQRTAQESRLEATAEGSVLASSALNVQSAYVWALSVACEFSGDDFSAVVFKLNLDFELNNMTAEQRRQTIEEWIKEAISFTEMRMALRKSGSAILDDAEVIREINDARDEAVRRAEALLNLENFENDQEDDNGGDE